MRSFSDALRSKKTTQTRLAPLSKGTLELLSRLPSSRPRRPVPPQQPAEFTHSTATAALLKGELGSLTLEETTFTRVDSRDGVLRDCLRQVDLRRDIRHAYWVDYQEQAENFALYLQHVGGDADIQLHGTSDCLPTVPCCDPHGLRPGTGGMWGAGIYTTAASGYVVSPPHGGTYLYREAGVSALLLVKVASGVPCVTPPDAGLRLPPAGCHSFRSEATAVLPSFTVTQLADSVVPVAVLVLARV